MNRTITNKVRVNLVKPLPPRIIYSAGQYDNDIEYKSNALQTVYVELDGFYYYLDKQGTFKGINPRDSVALNDGTWRLMDNFQIVLTDTIIANGGKVGGWVFYDGWFISQYGVDKNGKESTKYEDFPNGTFIPNIQMNAKTGEATFNKATMKYAKITDAYVTGTFINSVNRVKGSKTRVSEIDISMGFNIHLLTDGVKGDTNTFNLSEEIKNKYLNSVVRISKYRLTVNNPTGGWIPNQLHTDVDAVLRFNAEFEDDDRNFEVQVPPIGYIELIPIKRDDIDVIYPDPQPPYLEQRSYVKWAITNISTDAQAHFNTAELVRAHLIVNKMGYRLDTESSAGKTIRIIPKECFDLLPVRTIVVNETLNYTIGLEDSDTVGRELSVVNAGPSNVNIYDGNEQIILYANGGGIKLMFVRPGRWYVYRL